MRVCMVTTSYPRHEGDFCGFFVERIARELTARGWQVRVVAPHAAGLPTREERNGIEIRRFRYAWPAGLEQLCYGAGIPSAIRSKPWVRLLLPAFAHALYRCALRSSRDCDILHCMWLMTAWFGRRVAVKRGMPLISTALGSDLGLAGRPGLMRNMSRRALAQSDAVTIVGTAQRQEIERLGVTPRRIELIPNGVDEAFLTPPATGPKPIDVLFVGRLAQEKRPLLLLEAMKILRAGGRRVTASLVGQGPLHDELAEFARREGLDGVEMPGIVSHDQVSHIMDCSKMLVLVSQREGLPNVVVEAMARGLAVLATDVGSVSQVVEPGRTGQLLPRDVSAEALAAAIQRLIDDPAMMQSMGKAAREAVVSRFTWQAAGEQYDRLYRDVLRSR